MLRAEIRTVPPLGIDWSALITRFWITWNSCPGSAYEPEHAAEILPLRLGLGPSGEVLGRLVHQRHSTLDIGGDHPLGEAAQRHQQVLSL
jgi:hypothetical protein